MLERAIFVIEMQGNYSVASDAIPIPMAEPLTSAAGFLGFARTVFSLTFDQIKRRDDKKVLASAAFRKAMTETEIYCASGTADSDRNREQELTLARVWSEAAANIAPRDKELSDFCLNISRYWINPPEDPLKAGQELLQIIVSVFSSARERNVVFMPAS